MSKMDTSLWPEGGRKHVGDEIRGGAGVILVRWLHGSGMRERGSEE